ncbi:MULTISPECIES: hypothetical protein [Colwellia]|uniref:Uncharacterized protein n=1 Tax=Colwellia marinimaniae TaxID=1513592 RepID=A0ABQ0MWX8_9GAMM|nr:MULTISPECIES: hypothetical protein [Colwellia]GAW96878.1 hypothetical protein MTCD1_02501 [Colwellia marinimaniae]
MTMQIASSGNLTPTYHIQPVSPVRHQGEPRADLSDILTPEQKNTVQQGVDDKIAEQVAQVKSNVQTAKDIDLMQSHYQQQQKLFDIYLQTSTESNIASDSTQANQRSSAVSVLSNSYADLYQLHQNVKEGVGDFIEHKSMQTLPARSVSDATETAVVSASNQPLALKQVDAYQSLMMPSTASYVYLTA